MSHGSGTGRRGGTDIYAAGAFDLSHGNRAGNSEELGEASASSVFQLDAAKSIAAATSPQGDVTAAQQATADAVASEVHFAFNSTHIDEKPDGVPGTGSGCRTQLTVNDGKNTRARCTSCQEKHKNDYLGLVMQSTKAPRIATCMAYP